MVDTAPSVNEVAVVGDVYTYWRLIAIFFAVVEKICLKEPLNVLKRAGT